MGILPNGKILVAGDFNTYNGENKRKFVGIKENNVEFVFENINLPFDNAANDGYVSFKVKTRPTLVGGDLFSNTANIYFDYNYPIGQ